MTQNNNFRCPNCRGKISVLEIFKFKKIHQTVCPNCKSRLLPKHPILFEWGFVLGFLGFVIPAKLATAKDGPWYGLLSGILGAGITLSAMVIYLYLKTEFVEHRE